MTDKEIIKKSLRMNDGVYENTVEDYAFIWLKSRLIDDDLTVHEITKGSRFWAWWINQWEIRDAEFIKQTNLRQINEVLTGNTLYVALELYKDKHNPLYLKIIPNRMVIDFIDAVVKNELIKEEKNVTRS